MIIKNNKMIIIRIITIKIRKLVTIIVIAL